MLEKNVYQVHPTIGAHFLISVITVYLHAGAQTQISESHHHEF